MRLKTIIITLVLSNFIFTLPNIFAAEYSSNEISQQLIDAAQNGDHPAVKALLTNDANPNMQDSCGKTPLHYAANYGIINIASTLLEHEADLTIKDGDENTPLHLATIYGHHEIAALLLEHGADPNEKNIHGKTASYFIEKHASESIQKKLKGIMSTYVKPARRTKDNSYKYAR